MVPLTPSSSLANDTNETYLANGDTKRINFANFNQDFSCISVGFDDGYRIYNCEPFTCCYEHEEGAVGIIEMLFCSSLLAIVGSGDDAQMSPRKLKIVNSKRNTTICELTFQTSILAIKMNRDSLIVVLEETIYVYDITGMRLLHTIETPPNPTGLVALSSNIYNNYLAYPSPQLLSSNTNGDGTEAAANLAGDPQPTQSVRNGDIVIFDCTSLHPISVIEAHKTQVSTMAYSNDGTLLATASDKGTIIRVFSVETGVKLYQFRRGSYNAQIYSLAFSPDNMFVIASSATETVHVFRLGEEEAKNTILKSKGTTRWLSGKPNASDKDIELTRQQELEKILKNRETRETDGTDDELEDDQGLVFDPLQQHSDSEDEELEFENGELDGEEEQDVLQPLPSSSPNTSKNDTLATSSIFSATSGGSSGSGNRIEPIVDKKRRSMARLLRKTSQSIGRKAAERMGVYLPPRFSSILEPNRHFASLKVPVSKETPTVVAIMQDPDDTNSLASVKSNLVHILVVSAEGKFYTYGLDPERGGDCILLSEKSLL